MPSRHSNVCQGNHIDCFAFGKYGKCTALNETIFKGGKDCPFYKTQQERWDGHAKGMSRLMDNGMQHIYDKHCTAEYRSWMDV